MSTTTIHSLLSEQATESTTTELQRCVTTLIDLGLQLKQAHWNLIGDRFLSFHVQLDAIIATARDAADEVAERIAAFNVAVNGRASDIATNSNLSEFPEGQHHVQDAVELTAERLAMASDCLRKSIEVVSEDDPISEDLLVGICRSMEKHLWKVQSQLK
ncbi:MAG: DNA starvation/stationary phase protection protein [Planctomycetales bacterium]|nr:DNA starvation/stationary phase protection protein [Planctomycetales bacterium]